MGNCQSLSDQLKIRATTWNKDTHRLYDYESVDLTTQEFRVKETSFFSRNPNQPSSILQSNINTQLPLLYILVNSQIKILKVGPSKYKMRDTNAVDDRIKVQKAWISVRSVGKVLLGKNDIFRLGRVTFRIWDLNLNMKEWSDTSVQSNKNDSSTCRICLRSSQPNNPLLNPCKCSGSLKYIHLECLKRWLREKNSSRSNEYCSLYLWKDLICEICHHEYKPIFESDGITYHMNEIVKPSNGYIILEFQCKKNEHSVAGQGDPFTKKSQGVYVVKLKEEMTIGRAKENQIRVGDVSISRFHSKLTLENGNVYLYDNNAKYGSLLLIQDDIIFLPEHDNIEIQVGRSLFKFLMSNYC